MTDKVEEESDFNYMIDGFIKKGEKYVNLRQLCGMLARERCELKNEDTKMGFRLCEALVDQMLPENAEESGSKTIKVPKDET